jgi:hypothetical protein
MLKHPPHRLDIVAGKAQVALGIQLLLKAQFDPRCATSVILRVTKASPRRGLSWLKRMPLLAKMP